uniref:Uncharacterized protein n=1 Tax=Strigamia maritima TaxID=126957 RepID=T1JPH9_STRMM
KSTFQLKTDISKLSKADQAEYNAIRKCGIDRNTCANANLKWWQLYMQLHSTWILRKWTKITTNDFANTFIALVNIPKLTT